MPLSVHLTLENWNLKRIKATTGYICAWKCEGVAGSTLVTRWDRVHGYLPKVPLCRLRNLLNISIPFIVFLILGLRIYRTLFLRQTLAGTSITTSRHSISLYISTFPDSTSDCDPWHRQGSRHANLECPLTRWLGWCVCVWAESGFWSV